VSSEKRLIDLLADALIYHLPLLALQAGIIDAGSAWFIPPWLKTFNVAGWAPRSAAARPCINTLTGGSAGCFYFPAMVLLTVANRSDLGELLRYDSKRY